MSIKIMSMVWDHAQLRGSEFVVLLCLADFANDDGICFPSLNTIARKSRISRRQAIRIVQSLRAAGYINVIEQGGIGNDGKTHSNRYLININRLVTPMTPSDTHDTTPSDTHDTTLVTSMSPDPPMNHQLNHHYNTGRGGDSTPDGVKPDLNVSDADKKTNHHRAQETLNRDDGSTNETEENGGAAGGLTRSELVGAVYRHYEDNVGLLTPIIADNLGDLVDEYGPGWVSEAIDIAVQAEKRNLRYVHGILKRWKANGKGAAQPNPKDIDAGPLFRGAVT